ncbi:MAG: OadG family protein [Deltaproteobacteria bacterium]|nr:OadG family protein [Deltaproteobacteria bacterium]
MEKGLELLVAGMGGVFLFLSLMVLIMYLASMVLKKFEKPEAAIESGTGGNEQLAMIAAAIAVVKNHTQG